jgi:hypothetical protein
LWSIAFHEICSKPFYLASPALFRQEFDRNMKPVKQHFVIGEVSVPSQGAVAGNDGAVNIGNEFSLESGSVRAFKSSGFP